MKKLIILVPLILVPLSIFFVYVVGWKITDATDIRNGLAITALSTIVVACVLVPRLIMFVPLTLFCSWVIYYKITGGVIWLGFLIAALYTIGLGQIIGPKKHTQQMYSATE